MFQWSNDIHEMNDNKFKNARDFFIQILDNEYPEIFSLENIEKQRVESELERIWYWNNTQTQPLSLSIEKQEDIAKFLDKANLLSDLQSINKVRFAETALSHSAIKILDWLFKTRIDPKTDAMDNGSSNPQQKKHFRSNVPSIEVLDLLLEHQVTPPTAIELLKQSNSDDNYFGLATVKEKTKIFSRIIALEADPSKKLFNFNSPFDFWDLISKCEAPWQIKSLIQNTPHVENLKNNEGLNLLQYFSIHKPDRLDSLLMIKPTFKNLIKIRDAEGKSIDEFLLLNAEAQRSKIMSTVNINKDCWVRSAKTAMSLSSKSFAGFTDLVLKNFEFNGDGSIIQFLADEYLNNGVNWFEKIVTRELNVVSIGERFKNQMIDMNDTSFFNEDYAAYRGYLTFCLAFKDENYPTDGLLRVLKDKKDFFNHPMIVQAFPKIKSLIETSNANDFKGKNGFLFYDLKHLLEDPDYLKFIENMERASLLMISTRENPKDLKNRVIKAL
jgi:hypothetical protein